jgi:hypothetical protein
VNATPEQCEILALRLGRQGAFVEMSYRLFPETRNSFTPDLLELGFDFQEMRLINASTELRFQIFPSSMINPLKKRLEDVRNQLRAADEGPFPYTGAPFLNHDNLKRFLQLVEQTRAEIRAELRSALVDNYNEVRKKALVELRRALETLLPRLGVENTRDLFQEESWFSEIFPAKGDLSGDLRLDVHIYNVHPRTLMHNPELRKLLQDYLEQPQQMTLFGRG